MKIMIAIGFVFTSLFGVNAAFAQENPTPTPNDGQVHIGVADCYPADLCAPGVATAPTPVVSAPTFTG